jgi:tRNA threonylcarbamoyladenosine biosynthesis protein TsaE
MLKNGLKLKTSKTLYPKQALLYSIDETLQLGRLLGKEAQNNAIFCLNGPLGAGKTTLIKGIAEGALNLPKECVNSPTFTLLNIYCSISGKKMYHFDLYRLKNVSEFLSLGFEEYLNDGGICCIEWSEKISPLLDSFPVKNIDLNYFEDKRQIVYGS